MIKASVYPVIAAVVLGAAALASPQVFLSPPPALLDVQRVIINTYGALGVLLGLVWPRGAWRWGLWLTAPVVLAVAVAAAAPALSVVYPKPFIELALALIGSVLGAQLGALVGRRLGASDSRRAG